MARFLSLDADTVSFRCINTNGHNVQNSNGSYTTLPPTTKLKENITACHWFGSGTRPARQLKIRSRNFKVETGHDSDTVVDRFPIAHEVGDRLFLKPSLVFEKDLTVDEDGNKTCEVTKGIDQSKLGAPT
jgi:hypothetical protein